MGCRWLPGVPGCCIEKIFNAAPGNEIESGKFDSPESSARLAANAFGIFLCHPACLPPLPGCKNETWPAVSLDLERTVRFPWSGGRHPVLDVLVETPCALIGIESKRFEPFRNRPKGSFSKAFWRPVWGNRMKGYQRVRDKLHKNRNLYTHLDAAQLVKHALALRTQVQPSGKWEGLTPILFYVYAEPDSLPNSGESIGDAAKQRHKKEVEDFADHVKCDEVKFVPCTYREMLACWKRHTDPEIRAHAEAVTRCFYP